MEDLDCKALCKKLRSVSFVKSPCYYFIEPKGEKLFLEKNGTPRTKKEKMIFSLFPFSEEDEIIIPFNEMLARILERKYVSCGGVFFAESLDELRNKNTQFSREAQAAVNQRYTSSVNGLSKKQEFVLEYVRENGTAKTRDLLHGFDESDKSYEVLSTLARCGLLERCKSEGNRKNISYFEYHIPPESIHLVDILLSKKIN